MNDGLTGLDDYLTTDPRNYDPDPDEPDCCICGTPDDLNQHGYQFICGNCESKAENNYDPATE